MVSCPLTHFVILNEVKNPSGTPGEVAAVKVMRMTIVYPKPDRVRETVALLKKLGEHMAAQPGFVEDYSLEEHGERTVVGRASVWENAAALHRAAASDHVIALRSQIIGTNPQAEHHDYMFEITGEHHRK